MTTRPTTTRPTRIGPRSRLAAAVAACLVSVSLAPAAQAAPSFTRCRAWHVQGQTWYAYQSNGYTVAFTLRTSQRRANRLYGFAMEAPGDPNTNRHAVGSQYISGAVRSEGGVGSILLNVVWQNGTSGQYNATAVNVHPSGTGGLSAGLHGTTVDTSGSGASATWDADGTAPTLGDRSHVWPLYCAPADVIGKRLGRA